MSRELRDLLQDAGRTATSPDLAAARARGRRRRTVRRVVGGLGVGVLLIGGAVGVRALLDASSTTSDHPAVQVGPEWTPYRNDVHRFSVELAPGWDRSSRTLSAWLSEPFEILAVASFQLSGEGDGPACDAQLPKSAVDGVGSDGVFLWVVESTVGVDAPGGVVTQEAFPARPSTFDLSTFREFDCSAPQWSYPNARFFSSWFEDRRRVIGAYLAIGNEAPQSRRDEAMRILDSLELDAAIEASPPN